MLRKFHPGQLCGDPEWETPHLYALRIVPGGAEERRCEYCGARDPADRPAASNLVPAIGTAAAIAVLCAVAPRIAVLLERIAVAIESLR